jgi:YVTN family beta-propeller protein
LTLLAVLNVALIAFGLSLDDGGDRGDDTVVAVGGTVDAEGTGDDSVGSATSPQVASTIPVTDGPTTSVGGGSTEAPGSSTTIAPSTTLPLAVDDGLTSSQRRLVDAFTVTGDELQPKSVVASSDGLFFAQNMMYRHNVSVYDRTGTQLAVIPDEIDLAEFGIPGGGVVQGSPVEAAVAPDGQDVYVSNYKIYGSGWNPVADDDCNRGDWDDSFVYRIDTTTYEIEAVIPTGAVPKFLAVSPDGSRVVVSNWCGFDVSIIDTATDSEITRVDVGRHPRGVAITADSRYAYVTVMGEAKIVVIDLASNAIVNTVPDAGTTPRHLVLSPDERYLYVSNNLQNLVRKIDLQLGVTVGTASTGNGTRTMAMSDDGESLYVVNYHDGTVSKVRTSDMEIIQTEYSGVHPVGITYDADTRQIWVSNYAGSLRVFTDT